MSKESRLERSIQNQINQWEQSRSSILKKYSKWSGLVLGVIIFLIYCFYACPYVVGGDNGEMVLTAWTLGVAHPPGYPLYTLFGKLFSFLPFGTIAYRISLLSALCDAGAAVLLFLAVSEWSLSLLGGVAAAVFFAFSPLVWTYATTAEVFAMNNLFGCGLIYLAVKWIKSRDLKIWCFITFWMGLGLSNHHTLVFFCIPLFLFYWIAVASHYQNKPRALLWCGTFVLGLLPYLYLPLASSRNPLVSWGDQTHVDGFFTHLLRKEYGTLNLTLGEEDKPFSFLERIILYFSTIPSQFAIWATPLPCVGAWLTLKNSKLKHEMGWLWLGTFLFYLLVFTAMANMPTDSLHAQTILARFWQLPNIILFAWAGIAVGELEHFLDQRFNQSGENGNITFKIISIVLILIMFFTQLIWTQKSVDRKYSDVFEELGKTVLYSLPKNSVLLTMGDHVTGTLRYVQMTQNLRSDVKIIDQNMLSYPWSKRWANQNFPELQLPGNGIYSKSGYYLKDFLDSNLSKVPVYVLGGFKKWDHSYDLGYKIYNQGFVIGFKPLQSEFDFDPWKHTNDQIFDNFPISKWADAPPQTWESLVVVLYWQEYRNFATQLLMYAVTHPHHEADIQSGISILEKIAKENIKSDPIVYKNLGLAYQYLSKSQPGAHEQMVKWWKLYLANPSEGDPDNAVIQKAMQ